MSDRAERLERYRGQARKLAFNLSHEIDMLARVQKMIADQSEHAPRLESAIPSVIARIVSRNAELSAVYSAALAEGVGGHGELR